MNHQGGIGISGTKRDVANVLIGKRESHNEQNCIFLLKLVGIETEQFVVGFVHECVVEFFLRGVDDDQQLLVCVHEGIGCSITDLMFWLPVFVLQLSNTAVFRT